MKTPRFLSGLSRSTIITIIACACFLAMAGMILLFFMMFPIDLQQNSMQFSAEETTTASETSTEPVREETVQSEGDPELSTWEATIDGETKPIHEHFGDSRPDDEPSDETETQQTDVPEETMSVEMTSESITDVVDPLQSTVFSESQELSSDVGQSTQTTYTETVPIETLPPPTQPVVNPDPTDPPIAEPTAGDE